MPGQYIPSGCSEAPAALRATSSAVSFWIMLSTGRPTSPDFRLLVAPLTPTVRTPWLER